MKNESAFTVLKGTGTVLIVDDEEMVLEAGVTILSRLGYVALGAISGEEVLEKYSDKLDEIDVVIIDMIMPGMSGGELYTLLKKLKPDIRVLMCSGYSMNESIQTFLDQGCRGFLQKPFSIGKLSKTIKNVLITNA